MYSTIITGGLHGLDCYLARVEVDCSRGLPGFEMVGLLGSEVKEARERIRPQACTRQEPFMTCLWRRESWPRRD